MAWATLFSNWWPALTLPQLFNFKELNVFFYSFLWCHIAACAIWWKAFKLSINDGPTGRYASYLWFELLMCLRVDHCVHFIIPSNPVKALPHIPTAPCQRFQWEYAKPCSKKTNPLCFSTLSQVHASTSATRASTRKMHWFFSDFHRRL